MKTILVRRLIVSLSGNKSINSEVLFIFEKGLFKICQIIIGSAVVIEKVSTTNVQSKK